MSALVDVANRLNASSRWLKHAAAADVDIPTALERIRELLEPIAAPPNPYSTH